MRFAWAAAGIVILCTAPFHERAVNALWKSWGERAKARSRKAGEEASGEDLLDNKRKWQFLIAGYCLFLLFVIFALISIFTLNQKINNLSETTQELKVTVQQMEQAR